MIYCISDIHGNKAFYGLVEYMNCATSDDLLIILGDIGVNFEQSSENKEFTEWFLSLDKNIAFIDGNHENFGYIYSFPREEWNGGWVHRISPYIVHLERGNIYTINNKTFFAFGGCKSSPKWKEMGLWYPGEEPQEEELELGYENLKKNNNRVDYVLTHKHENELKKGTVCKDLLELNDYIDQEVSFDKWYSGHWHISREVDEKHILVYDTLVKI